MLFGVLYNGSGNRYGQECTERTFYAKMISNANTESRRIKAEYTHVIKDIQKM